VAGPCAPPNKLALRAEAALGPRPRAGGGVAFGDGGVRAGGWGAGREGRGPGGGVGGKGRGPSAGWGRPGSEWSGGVGALLTR
jgi:hypothetical protein